MQCLLCSIGVLYGDKFFVRLWFIPGAEDIISGVDYSGECFVKM